MKRIFVEKSSQFQVKTKSFTNDIKTNLHITLKNVRIINVYDVDNLNDEQLGKAISNVFTEPLTDVVAICMDLKDLKAFAVELLPGQLDIRAESAMQCIKLLFPQANPQITTSTLYVFDKNISETDLLTIKNYIINPIESQEKNLQKFNESQVPKVTEIPVIENFINFDNIQLRAFLKTFNLAMSFEDLQFIQNYFKNTEKRDPTETEIKILDTYWSDHCRHTTFETQILNVTFADCELATEIKSVFDQVMNNHSKNSLQKHLTLMSLATSRFKEMLRNHLLPMVEISEENNACSIFVDVDIDGEMTKYLIQFKNETHNHPTEIEPFGGASTCLGGAIRDLLSGRSYVYQAMRVSGSGNPLEKIEDTLAHKLSQRHISKIAAFGFASYGNEVGLATTSVQEIVHPGYKAKRLEAGFVVGASLASNVRREKPSAGDLIILLGGATGRDGIGGATGSSDTHDGRTAKVMLAEVQKGNPTEERKLQRLFANPQFSKLIKKANDFGAGGVAIAIGELADGIEIMLDKVPLKYTGLNGTEIALSESQERMAIVIKNNDFQLIKQLAKKENIVASHVANVTDNNRLVMYWNKNKIVNIARSFIATNGVLKTTNAHITKQLPYRRLVEGISLEEKFLNNLKDLNVASQQSLTQLFDNTIGSTTVLMPYGGSKQLTKTHASVQKIPLLEGGFTNTSTYASFDFNPDLSSSSPFLGGVYAVIGSISKNLAHGGNLATMQFSFQEYFEKLGNDETKWGKPLASLLGAYKSLSEFNKAAIGGKDSMSGSFKELNVPPTLISFAISHGDAINAISSEFKKSKNYIYLLKHSAHQNMMPNFAILQQNFKFIEEKIKTKEIVSAWPIVNGGIAEGLAVMAFGNNLGFDIQTNEDLFDLNIGSFIIETTIETNHPNLVLLGKTTDQKFIVNNVQIDSEIALQNYQEQYEQLFSNSIKTNTKEEKVVITKVIKKSFAPTKFTNEPLVVIAVFPGTNCEFDIDRKFIQEGAKTKQVVFKNQTAKDIEDSINELEKAIQKADIFVIPGGFSGSDEPDGSGKFIANVLRNLKIMHALNDLRNRKGLILGICNGFQALVKCGLLPGASKVHNATLFRNISNCHISRYVKTKVTSVSSPWLAGLIFGETHVIPISHGEGCFVASQVTIEKLASNGQIAFQYVDDNNNPTMNNAFNPNGSMHAIEGVVSSDGLILGKMGHSERWEQNIAKNILGNKDQNIFKSAVQYFKGEFK